jgi:hypothetical protein
MKKERKCLVCKVDIRHLPNRCIRCKECQILERKRQIERNKGSQRLRSKSKGSNNLTRGIWKTFACDLAHPNDAKLKITSLKIELGNLMERRNDEDFINSLFKKYSIKLYPYDYPNLPESKRKYLKLLNSLRQGIKVCWDAKIDLIRQRNDKLYSQPFPDIEYKCIEDCFEDMSNLRGKINEIRYSLGDRFDEIKETNPEKINTTENI